LNRFNHTIDLQGNHYPKFAPVVIFGEKESGINIPLSALWEIHKLVSDAILPTLAGLAQ
jgi:hypothetical protein